MSTYEGEHTIFGLLSQANLTQNDVLQFHPFLRKKFKWPKTHEKMLTIPGHKGNENQNHTKNLPNPC
jgi:hypothetical protein